MCQDRSTESQKQQGKISGSLHLRIRDTCMSFRPASASMSGNGNYFSWCVVRRPTRRPGVGGAAGAARLSGPGRGARRRRGRAVAPAERSARGTAAGSGALAALRSPQPGVGAEKRKPAPTAELSRGKQGVLWSLIRRLPEFSHPRLSPDGQLPPWRACQVPLGTVPPSARRGTLSAQAATRCPSRGVRVRRYECVCVCVHVHVRARLKAQVQAAYWLILWSFCPSLRQPHVTLPAAPRLGLKQEPELLYYQLEGGRRRRCIKGRARSSEPRRRRRRSLRLRRRPLAVPPAVSGPRR
uniref:uncharacterized protein n=1 Tax=Lonchura striata TaxID=40157 RepID=UPI001293F7BB|nr:uncharacterized protein LOC116184638 [Lonchura striata domestica]